MVNYHFESSTCHKILKNFWCNHPGDILLNLWWETFTSYFEKHRKKNWLPRANWSKEALRRSISNLPPCHSTTRLHISTHTRGELTYKPCWKTMIRWECGQGEKKKPEWKKIPSQAGRWEKNEPSAKPHKYSVVSGPMRSLLVHFPLEAALDRGWMGSVCRVVVIEEAVQGADY